jgi:hypothetical protein
MNNNVYRLINFTGLIVLSFYIDKIGLIAYIPSCVLLWNVIEGVMEVDVVKEDKTEDLNILALKVENITLKTICKMNESVQKSNEKLLGICKASCKIRE